MIDLNWLQGIVNDAKKRGFNTLSMDASGLSELIARLESAEGELITTNRALTAVTDRSNAFRADAERLEAVAYLHRMEKVTELSFFNESANCTSRSDYIGCIPLFTGPQVAPEGWQRVPKVATPEMITAAHNAGFGIPAEWSAMLAAAPQQEARG